MTPSKIQHVERKIGCTISCFQASDRLEEVSINSLESCQFVSLWCLEVTLYTSESYRGHRKTSTL